MAFFNYPVRDFKVRLRSIGDFNKGKRRYGYKTSQQGVQTGGKKPKNGNRLVSSADIKRAERDSLHQVPAMAMKYAWPKIKL